MLSTVARGWVLTPYTATRLVAIADQRSCAAVCCREPPRIWQLLWQSLAGALRVVAICAVARLHAICILLCKYTSFFLVLCHYIASIDKPGGRRFR